MKIKQKEQNPRLKSAREHAFAVMLDRAMLVATAQIERIPTLTMVAHLKICFVDGNQINEKRHAEKALTYWHETGAMRYAGRTDFVSDRQQVARDVRLMETATAETMRNRRAAYFNRNK